ncbi:hypothetical protein P7C70_g3440, partial [Phenoliferia sp. Uapishka_3]
MGFGTTLGVSLGVVKSSVFIAKVEVIELAQVPLVHAKFRVKWSFKHPTTTHHVDHLDAPFDDSKGLLRTASASTRANPTYDGGRGLGGSRSDSPHQFTDSADESSASSRPSGDYPRRPLSPPMSPVEPRTPNPHRTPTPHQSAFPFANPQPFGASPDRRNNSSDTPVSPGGFRSSDDIAEHIPRRGATVTALEAPHPHAARAEPKGTTSFIPLRSHTAVFRREIQCPVAIPVKHLPNTSRYQLQPSPLRLAIRQEVPGDGGKKEEAKTGEVILDLSQFVGNGHHVDTSSRRYLLRDCKTNATLRVTVKMEWVGGERDFVAPQLVKSGQISSTSSPSLSNSTFSRSTASGKISHGSCNFSRGPDMINLFRAPVNSKKTPANGSANITRTNSSSSISINSTSTRSASLASGPQKPRGWHPTTSAFSSSPSPTLLGGTVTTNGSDRSAFDIIDTIFNRPKHNNSWGGFHQPNGGKSSPPEPSRKNGMEVGESEALVFSTRSRNGVLPTARSNRPGTGPRDSWTKETPPPPIPLSSSNSSLKPSNGRPTSTLSRRPSAASGASYASTRSKTRSVRWDDDAQPSPPVSGPRKGIVRHSSSSSSLKNLREKEEDDAMDLEGADEYLAGRKGVVGAKNAAIAAEKMASAVRAEEDDRLRMMVKEKALPPAIVPFAVAAEKEVVKKQGIDWAKSWG